MSSAEGPSVSISAELARFLAAELATSAELLRLIWRDAHWPEAARLDLARIEAARLELYAALGPLAAPSADVPPAA